MIVIVSTINCCDLSVC